jgi:2-methylisocitrate lyase-like PEP mutase family enzyme
MTSQYEKARDFDALHTHGVFLMPNPWDAGSARLLEGLGFRALATSSGACANTMARRDGEITRDEALAHARAIVNATALPVSADLENGFGPAPETVAQTIALAAAEGLIGGSIEDAGEYGKPPYDFAHAVERIEAAVEAARALPFRFMLTARTENYTRGRPDLDDTIRRLQAFERAGADVLFAPALPDLAAVREVCAAVSKPVNFMVGVRGRSFSVSELQSAGVRRVSFASSLQRAALGGFIAAAREILEHGTFDYVERACPTPELMRLMSL